MENLSGFEVGTNSVVTATATVPLNIREGSNEVRVVGWDDTVAQAFLTIPQPTLSLDPESSGRGSQVTVTGAGFVAGSGYASTMAMAWALPTATPSLVS